jgi:hypothetical protein
MADQFDAIQAEPKPVAAPDRNDRREEPCFLGLRSFMSCSPSRNYGWKFNPGNWRCQWRQGIGARKIGNRTGINNAYVDGRVHTLDLSHLPFLRRASLSAVMARPAGKTPKFLKPPPARCHNSVTPACTCEALPCSGCRRRLASWLHAQGVDSRRDGGFDWGHRR